VLYAVANRKGLYIIIYNKGRRQEARALLLLGFILSSQVAGTDDAVLGEDKRTS
jgi:hypothetical protein